ncbi:MAG: ATP-binding protein [Bdellovibrionia bacterium]
MMGWKKLSISKKLTFIVGLMAFLIAGELLALAFSMNVLSAVRAFVEGEGDWSKAQKNAIFDLQHYALTHSESDYQEFLSEFTVSEGDQMARTELMKPLPNMDIVRKGLIQGHVHPDDIDSVVKLIRHFYWVSYLDQAIQYWHRGDDLMAALKDAGAQYRDTLSKHPPEKKKLEEIAAHIRTINRELTVLEENFSTALGEGSRWLEHIVLSLLFAAVLSIESIGLTLTYLTSRRITRGLAKLNEAAQRIGQGDFDHKLKITSHDEIGRLKESINQMGTLLSGTYQTLERRVQERTLELSKLAEENSQLYEKTKDALESRDEFLSIASHELKTPLSGMYLQLQLMRKLLPQVPPSETTDKYKRLLEGSIKQTEMLNGLVEELLDLTRIRAGKLELRKQECDLKPILDKSLTQLSLDITRSKSPLSVDADSKVVGNFDPLRMSQLMTNLISNAVKYGAGKPIEVSLRSLKSMAEFQVKDQGLGIPEEKQKAIFERFERADLTKEISGLGLGLYITKQLIEAHGGKIQVESQVGQGSVFKVLLPLDAVQ